MEYEDKRTLAWAIYGLANMEITKQEFERRALRCVDETLEIVKNLTIPGVVQQSELLVDFYQFCSNNCNKDPPQMLAEEFIKLTQ